jgi:deferrochelatase/peroxidase EfeB
VPANSVDESDIQGLVRFGHAHMTEACYLLLRIRDAAAARAWIASAPVTTAVKSPGKPATALQVAFTAAGLRALGVPERVLGGFSAEFLAGMTGEDSRSRRLGDVGPNAPGQWQWGSPKWLPDLLVMLFAEPGKLQDWQNRVQGSAWDAAFETLASLPTSDLDGREPFGFIDGISQPAIDWDRSRGTAGDQIEYGNIVALGEFLLGYPNEYGKYTDRPLLDSAESFSGELLPAEDHLGKKDLGRNGTYLVMRQLEQDVRGFWRFVDQAAQSEPRARRRLAEAMVGRDLDGAPLVPLSPGPIPGIEENPRNPPNRFTFDGDPEGTRCPFGGHIRRANPRNADLFGRPSWFLSRWLHMLGWGLTSFREDLIASTRFHRILRRGREYGPGLHPDDAVTPAPPGDPPRGLHFICINANISRQFEFVQNAWLMSTKFDALTGESDPLLGNRTAVGDCPDTGNFSVQREGAAARRTTGLPQFITVRGGAYFFLPSLRALRYFARVTTHI